MNKNKLIILFLCCCVFASTTVHAGIHWSSAPLLVAEKNKNRRTESTFRAENFNIDKAVIYPPGKNSIEPKTVKLDNKKRINFKAQKSGNYHWISAQNASANLIATTVKYFSRPGPSPKKLLTHNKAVLEISPVHLPREHNSYRANESWKFRVSYQAQALADANIQMDTSNGSRLTFKSDKQGIFSVQFPDDFAKSATSKEKPTQHSHRRMKAQFVLSVTHQGIISAFNYSYSPDAFNKKSILPAVILVVIAMLITGIILFRRKSV